MDDFTFENFQCDFDDEFQRYDPDSDSTAKIPHFRNENEKRQFSFIPGHLSSPICEDECKYILDLNFKWQCERHRKIQTFLKRFNNVQLLTDLNDDPISFIQNWIRAWIFNKNSITCSEALDFSSLVKYHKLHFLSPFKNGGLIEKEKIIKDCEEKTNKLKNDYSSFLARDFDDMKKVEFLKDNICFREIPMGNFISFNNMLYSERDISIMIVGELEALIFPTTLLLCAMDKMQSIFPLKTYWAICDVNEKYPNHSLFRTGEKLIKIFTGLRGKLGQSFFTFMDAWEGLVKGFIIAMEGDSGCSSLYENQLSDIQEILNEKEVNFDLTEVLPSGNSKLEIIMFLELTGIVKSFGHPILRTENSLDALREYGTKNLLEIDDLLIKEVEGVMRRDFIRNYYKKHSRYPKFSSYPKEFEPYFGKGKKVSKKYFKNYELWRNVIFAKTLEYDYTKDQTTLLKDSATAVELSCWGSAYDRCSWNLHYSKRPPQSFYKKSKYNPRTLLSYLHSTDPDEVRTIINEREKGIYDEDDHVAVECMKEQELKTKGGRAFTKQTPRQRIFQTSLEYNISHIIFPYVPEQSMTDGEILVQKRIIGQILMMDGNTDFISMDLKKWCNFQRHATTYFCGRMYDELFGFFGVFENSHNFFIDCNVFCTSRLHPPDYDSNGNPIPGPFFLNRFIGGMEGLQQKKWTHVTICAIKLSTERASVNTVMMGQGDNQVILLKYPDSDKSKRKETRENLLNQLTIIFEGIHHKLKPKETWFSSKLHEYGKILSYDRINVSCGTKKAASLIPDINDGLFSFMSSCSTINTMTESIARYDYLPDTAFMLNQILLGNYVSRKNIFNNRDRLEKIRLLMLHPADFGGISLSNYLSHGIRGYDDKLVHWIGVSKTIQEINPKLFSRMMEIWQNRPFKTAETPKERSRLIEDIYCLNIDSLPSADSEIRERALDFLIHSGEVKQPHIKKLLVTDFQKDKEKLLSDLDQMVPFYLPMAHEILKNSNVGLVMAWRNRFTRIDTIQKMVSERGMMSLIDFVRSKNEQAFEKIRINYNSKRYTNCQDIYLKYSCPTKIATELRLLSWGKDLLSVTKPPFNHQFVVKNIDEATEEDISKSIVIKVNNDLVKNPKLGHMLIGPYKPYAGSSTTDKVKKATLDIAERTSFSRAFENLSIIRSWCLLVGATNLLKLVDALLAEKADHIELIPGTPLKEEDVLSSVISGNPLHRFRNSVETPYALCNFLVVQSSHFSQSSNEMANMTMEGEDYSLFFQGAFLYGILGLSIIGKMKGEICPGYISKVCCYDSCTEDVSDVKFDLIKEPSRREKISIPFEKSYFRCTIKYDNIQDIFESHIASIFAKNIDENYSLSHLSETDVEKITTSKATTVSMNDLRRCNIKNIFCMMIAKSNHCRTLIKEDSPLLSEQSNDKSFEFFAECLMNSGLLPSFLSFMPKIMNEHRMATCKEKMTHFIGKCIVPFFKTNIDYFLESNLKIIFRKELGTVSQKIILKFLARCYGFKHKLSRNKKSDIIHLLNKNMSSFFRSIDSEMPRIIHMEPDESVLQWRQDEITKIDYRKIIYNQIELAEKSTEEYPWSQVFSYFQSKSLSDQNYISFEEAGYIGRTIGHMSTSSSKFKEARCMLGIEDLEVPEFINGKKTFGCFYAEGAGGMLTSFMAENPQVNGIYNTLISEDIDLRDDPTQLFPPAMIGSYPELLDKVYYKKETMMGETDILTENFIKKNKKILENICPFMVTMDAESMSKTNNYEFIETFLPHILESDARIVFFKLFHLGPITDLVLKKMETYKKYDTVFVKPITSNPNGFEFYAIFIHEEIQPGIMLNIERSKLLWKTVENTLTQNKLRFNEDTLVKYGECSRLMGDYLVTRCRIKSLVTPHKYTFLVESKQICNMSCLKFFDYLWEAIDLVNVYNSEETISTFIREGGINKNLERLIMDFIFFCLNHESRKYNRNLSDLCIMLKSVHLLDLEKFRKKESICYIQRSPDLSGNFLDKWGDSKFGIRDYVNQSQCTCKPVMRVWTKTMDTEAISSKIFKNIVESGICRNNFLKNLCRSIVSQDEYDYWRGKISNINYSVIQQ